ncbi:VOC family protein [Lentzea sp. CA-135723]|uniref:VOC family protein n=1 Tax=Lentzea sp. CA-135723 TaxID=3239950 RepID=UPI003D919D1A
MTVQLNHTIVLTDDRHATAGFITEVLGLEPARSFADEFFLVIDLANDVQLEILQIGFPFQPQHFAFLVSEEEFDQIFGRIQSRNIEYFAEHGDQRPGEINHLEGGRGVYFTVPGGHSFEILTRPYGADAEALALTQKGRM